MPPIESPQFASWMLQVLPVAYLAVTFLQSGLDKVFDWKGNLSWQTGFFSKVPVLRSQVKPMLATLTVLEIARRGGVRGGHRHAGGHRQPPAGVCGRHPLSGVTLVALLFGQRIAKDYAGASGLGPYFLVSLAAIFFNRG